MNRTTGSPRNDEKRNNMIVHRCLTKIDLRVSCCPAGAVVLAVVVDALVVLRSSFVFGSDGL